MKTIRLRDRVTGLITDHPEDLKDDLLAQEGGPDGGPRHEVVPEGKSAADYDRERDEADAKEVAKAEAKARKAAGGDTSDTGRADKSRS